jgi:hypothetical protein
LKNPYNKYRQKLIDIKTSLNVFLVLLILEAVHSRKIPVKKNKRLFQNYLTMVNSVCRLNQFGHCKFGELCNFKHINDVCEIEACEIKGCSKRHPRNCRYILKHGRCKFGEFCSFNHKVGQILIECAPRIQEILENKIEDLEKLVSSMKNEIVNLESGKQRAN